MVGHLVFHGRPYALLKARAWGSRFAAARKWRFDDRAAQIVALREKTRHERWMAEETAKNSPKRSLIEDNPASG